MTSGVHRNDTFSQINSVNDGSYNSSLSSYYWINNSTTIFALKDALSGTGVSLHTYGKIVELLYPSSFSHSVRSILEYFDGSIHQLNPNLSFSPYVTFYRVNNTLDGLPFVPSQIASAYHFSWAYEHGIYGNGTTIAIVDAYGDPSLLYDINAFDEQMGLPPIKLQIDGSTGNSNNTSWAVETALDVEWAHAMAPGAKILLYLSPNSSSGLEAALSQIVSERLANVISLSWGTPESDIVKSGSMPTFESIYQKAAEENITVVAASGDQGAYDGTSSLQVNFPASSPYVTAVGGTSLYLSSNGYQQQAWGGTLSGTTFGSGGGYSSYFPEPYWQEQMGLKNLTGRGVPDVALDANPETGAEIVVSGLTYNVGGTSLATPMFAAVAALMDQYTGTYLGNVNPLLYHIASNNTLYQRAFIPIISGNNGYYKAHYGWNPVTGLGSPNVSELLNITGFIRNPHGTAVLFSGSEYNYTSISASLSIAQTENNEFGNGTTYYYAGFAGQYGGQLLAGVGESANGFSAIVIANDSSADYMISSTISYSHSFNIMVSYSTSLLFKFSVNGFSLTLPLMFNVTGMLLPSVGVEQINSSGDQFTIPTGIFSNITFPDKIVWNSSLSFTPLSYSGLGPYYGNVNFTISGNNISFGAGINQHSTNANQNATVLYSFSGLSPSDYHFFLSNKTLSTSAIWYEDGHQINSFTLLSPGNYTIKAEADGKTFIRNIVVPALSVHEISIQDGNNFNTSGYVILDHTMKADISFTNNTSLSYYLPPYTANISMSFIGYYSVDKQIGPGSNITVYLRSIPVKLSLFTSFTNLTVSADGNRFDANAGYFQAQVLPGSYNISINGTRISNVTFTQKILPGGIYNMTFILRAKSGYHAISGFVEDKLFGFPIYGAAVSAHSGISYTNDSGFFIIFVDSSTSTNLTFSAYLYNSTSLIYPAASNGTLTVKLSPNSSLSIVTKSQFFFARISIIIPLLFYYYYITWSVNFPNVSFYRILYAPTDNFSDANYVTEPASSSSALIPVGLGHFREYFTILAFSSDGSYIGSSSLAYGSYSGAVPLLINGGIFLLIALYVVFMVRFFTRRGRNKGGKKDIFEDEFRER